MKTFTPGQQVWVKTYHKINAMWIWEWVPGVYSELHERVHEVVPGDSEEVHYFRDSQVLSEEEYAALILTT